MSIPCCSYPVPHEHYPDWLRHERTTDFCVCGKHPRTMTVEALLRVFKEKRS